ncbi:MAG: UDP-glucose/GDP-mannose dehydrogenase family protein [Gemmatimonadetes bacterium]|nr:UDP-glucose/GDP-mannose dehydrogenase family protein [Gemmatimonadota bacterium]
MRVAVVGTGYVGLVVGACLAETGNDVVCADLDKEKIAGLKKGRIPIYEPGLEPLVVRNQREGRLTFTTDVGSAVESSEVVFVAVGTPPDEDGSADLQHVLDVAKAVGQHMNSPKVVITKSTVPVGTAQRVREEIAKYTDTQFYVCSNPEFLKEGAAVDDFMRPDRVVVGVDSDEAQEILSDLFAPFVRTGNPLIFMDIASAELTKYTANAMLAARISFMNQIAELCERVGADVAQVRKGIGSDSRIGKSFLFPGPGYGGSCFPKDVRALIRTAADCEVTLDLLLATEKVNQKQKKVLFEKLSGTLDGRIEDSRIAIWGLAFKAETDDMRESPSLSLISALVDAGARVIAHDPEAIRAARDIFGETIFYADHMYDALSETNALVVVTEWSEYRNPDFERMKSLMAEPLIVDGRNLYDPGKMRELGFEYHCLGRGNPV